MQWIRAVMVLLMGAALAAAQVEDARRAQVDAAVRNAVENLYGEVTRTPIYSRMTVGQLVDRVGGRDDLIRTLQGAQQIGGPRWLDDQTAQVRLEIAGPRVARTVVQLAASNPKTTPMSAAALEPLLQDWNNKTFGAYGTSTGAAAVEELRPVTGDGAWGAVPEQVRRDTIAAARQAAVGQVMDAVKGVELKPGVTVGQVMARQNSPVGAGLEQYLAARPVTSVQFREDRSVQLALSAPPDEIADLLRVTVTQMADPSLAGVDWDKVRQQVAQRVGAGTVGTAKVAEAGAAQPAAGQMVQLPERPPEWAEKQIDASATALNPSSKLKAARGAEERATQKLQAQVEALPLTPGTTLGEAARRDPRVGEALGRGMQRARVYKCDYREDGSVTVHVSLDLRDLWEELRQVQ